MASTHKSIILFMAGLALLFAVLYSVGFREVLNELVKVNLFYIILLFLIQLLMMCLWALKWFIVLRRTGVSFWSVLPVSFTGYLINNVTPIAGAGGEPVRAYLLARKESKLNTERAAASVVVDLFLEVMPLFMLVVLTIYLVFKYGAPMGMATVIGSVGVALALLFILFIVLLSSEQVSRRIITFIIKMAKHIPVSFLREHALDAEDRLEDIILEFRRAMRETVRDKSILVYGTITSIVIWLVSIARMYIIFMALGYNPESTVHWISILVIARVIVALVSFLSILPGAIGLWEGVSTGVFTLLGLPAPLAMAAALLERAFSFWIGSLIGGMASVYLGVEGIADPEWKPKDKRI